MSESRRRVAEALAGRIDRSRPILENNDGSFSTEETITVPLTIGQVTRWVNIPTIVGGQRVSPEQAEALFHARQNPAVQPPFATVEEAEAAARARSQQIGTVRQSDRRR